jgi:hypothetical protein
MSLEMKCQEDQELSECRKPMQRENSLNQSRFAAIGAVHFINPGNGASHTRVLAVLGIKCYQPVHAACSAVSCNLDETTSSQSRRRSQLLMVGCPVSRKQPKEA